MALRIRLSVKKRKQEKVTVMIRLSALGAYLFLVAQERRLTRKGIAFFRARLLIGLIPVSVA